MRTTLWAGVMAALFGIIAVEAHADTYVRGYTRNDGTYRSATYAVVAEQHDDSQIPLVVQDRRPVRTALPVTA